MCTDGRFSFYKKYTKTPIDVPAQIDLLLKRGLIISDKDKAAHYLNTISYFRLSAYMHVYQEADGKHQFKAGTKLDDITDVTHLTGNLGFSFLMLLKGLKLLSGRK